MPFLSALWYKFIKSDCYRAADSCQSCLRLNWIFKPLPMSTKNTDKESKKPVSDYMRRFICQIAPLSHHCCQLDRLLSPSRRLSCSQLPNLTLAMSSKPVHILFYLPHIPLSSRFWTIRDVRMNSSCTAPQRQDIFVYLTRRKVVPPHS